MLFCVLPHERVGVSLKRVSPLFSNHNVPDSHCPQNNHQSVSAYQPSGCSDLRRLQSSSTDRLSDARSLTSALKQPTLIPTVLLLTRYLRFCCLYLSFIGCRFVLAFLTTPDPYWCWATEPQTSLSHHPYFSYTIQRIQDYWLGRWHIFEVFLLSPSIQSGRQVNMGFEDYNFPILCPCPPFKCCHMV